MNSITLKIISVITLLIPALAHAEIYRGIGPGSTMADLKALFPGAKIEFVKTAWAKEGESLYQVTGQGLPGTMVIKITDVSVNFRKYIDNNPEEDFSEGFRNLAVSSEDTMNVSWVRYVPDEYIPIERLVSKYGPAEKSGFSEDDYSPYKSWGSKGVFAELTDNLKFVTKIDFTFTEKEWCDYYKESESIIPDSCNKKSPAAAPKKEAPVKR